MSNEGKMNKKHCERQIQLMMLRAQWWLASATSGHYKQRNIKHGTITNGGPDFTDEEKLADTMATADRHIRNAQEFIDALAEREDAETSSDWEMVALIRHATEKAP
jgi:hypothetical protein